jgi:hypothetical protein
VKERPGLSGKERDISRESGKRGLAREKKGARIEATPSHLTSRRLWRDNRKARRGNNP